MKVVLGLGNPGREFAGSRHNVGHRCIDILSRRRGLRLERRRLVALAQTTIGDAPVVLARSRTFMNLSGRAAKYLVDRFRVQPQDVIVVYDEMDLPVGKVRIRAGGSSAGHKGLESVMAFMGTQEFPRLRIGIGRPGGGAVGHVLGRFAQDELNDIQEAVERAAQAVEVMVVEGLEAAMSQFN